MSNFEFDDKSQRFRDKTTGKFLSRTKVVDLLNNQIALIQDDLQTVTGLLLQNKISVATWESEASLAIKKGNILAYLLGKGGKYQLVDSDKKRIEQKLRFEFGHLRKFASDILDGKLSANQIKDRISKYGDNFYSLYEQARRDGHYQNSYLWERRITSPGEICVDCQSIADRGWQRIYSLPAIGQSSRCMSRCRCEFIFSSEIERPTNWVLIAERIRTKL